VEVTARSWRVWRKGFWFIKILKAAPHPVTLRREKDHEKEEKRESDTYGHQGILQLLRLNSRPN